MTENAPPPDDESFAPDPSTESAAISFSAESNNVSRVAALATLLDPSRNAAARLFDPLRELGFSGRTVETAGFARERQFAPYSWLLESGLPPSASDNRMELWTDLNENADPTAAERFLLALLGSPLERESAAAAAVLVNLLPEPSPAARATWRYWRFRSPADPILLETLQVPPLPWPTDLMDADVDVADQASPNWDGQAWNSTFESTSSAFREPETQMYQVRLLVTARLRAALRSSDPITRSFAFAAQLAGAAGSVEPAPQEAGPRTPPGALVISTMIHGTFGWKGDWWRPSGDFHKYILGNYRRNLYQRGARFSWSGAYSAYQRALAAKDFVDWAGEVAPHGLQTLFTHSYGGDVAAQAVLAGVPLNELVLLSSPGTDPVNDAVSLGMNVVDVRLPFDPVLAIARAPQRLQPAPNVTEVLLDWSLDHSASHKAKVWTDQSVAARAGM